MPKIYFNRIVPASISAVQVNASFPASNLNVPSINKEYRSNDALGQQYLLLDFAVMTKMAGVFLLGGNSFDPFIAYNDGVSNFKISNLLSSRDGFNRRRVVDFSRGSLTDPDFFSRYVAAYFSVKNLNLLAELTYKTVVQAPAATNAYEYRNIKPTVTPTAYVVAAGDQLRYDVFINAANPTVTVGGMEMNFTTSPFNSRAAGVVDQNGTGIAAGSSLTSGAWFSRQLSLTPIVGKTLTDIQVVNESDTNGLYIARYRNIRITTSANVDKLIIWRGGRTDVNSVNQAQYSFGTLSAEGDTTDGAAFWRVGAAYVFSDFVQLAPAPDKNYVADYAHAQQSQKIINGNTAVWGVGATRREISLEWLRKYPEQLQTVLTETRKGICVLDMENPLMPENVWPVMCLDERLGSRFPRNNSEILTGMKLTEVC